MGSQLDQSTETSHFSLSVYLQCPKCGSSKLTESTDHIDCDKCNQSYPQFKFGNISIPFLFADVDAAIGAWCARINGFKKAIEQEIEHLNIQSKDKNNSRLTTERLKTSLKSKKQYKQQIIEHLESFKAYSLDEYAYNSSEIDKNQGVESYINNIFRDWCWNNGENEELLRSISKVVDSNFQAGISLTLGAGASRFSYDFHEKYLAKHSFLLDINPVLLGNAAKIINGMVVELNEFPVAPISIDDFTKHQKCKIACDTPEEFSFLLADALNAPLKEKSFDSILTPWLVDIIPIDLKDFITRVNRLLKVGGLWINSGSLAFFHKNQQCNYSQEEVIDSLKKFGFDDVKVARTKINYLNSPHSAHGRIEEVFSFSAKKKFDSAVPNNFTYFPEWVNDVNLSIPNHAELMAESSKHLLQAQVLSAINGQRSIIDIAQLLAKQYDMSEDSAISAVRQILLDNL
ncbi:MAG: class I SAM-dependent methyltransferase [Gammaproteobacteria bacterium]|nr:class I SAM-dependent methyltransferase [Gammaproteobacteria bacterium]